MILFYHFNDTLVTKLPQNEDTELSYRHPQRDTPNSSHGLDYCPFHEKIVFPLDNPSKQESRKTPVFLARIDFANVVLPERLKPSMPSMKRFSTARFKIVFSNFNLSPYPALAVQMGHLHRRIALARNRIPRHGPLQTL